MVQVEAVIVDQGKPVDRCEEKLIGFCRAREAVDRTAAELEIACDGAKAVATLAGDREVHPPARSPPASRTNRRHGP
ncbi:hypothetical protein OG906_35020 (plasmid) [Streptomyces sp. NBC_01426]|uniref:hypothetical protein n=1 Tax=Streptomyces sp. NBC_01426 TaxID=2975866 RepID=UPI002E2FD5C0|nr:hypothetical protein [Streptomyces sp. NBC_01426]